MSDKIILDLNELIEEHENLLCLLSTTIANLTKEYNKQVKELKQYRKRRTSLRGRGYK